MLQNYVWNFGAQRVRQITHLICQSSTFLFTVEVSPIFLLIFRNVTLPMSHSGAVAAAWLLVAVPCKADRIKFLLFIKSSAYLSWNILSKYWLLYACKNIPDVRVNWQDTSPLASSLKLEHCCNACNF